VATQVFSEAELEGRGFPEIDREQLVRFFTLTPTDEAFVRFTGASVWVILETIAAVAIGVAISLAVRRRWAHLGPLVRMGFALLGLASLLAPLLLGQGWPTKLLLALMHLVGVSTFVAATRVAPASAALRGQDPPQC
jgi:hypothetical protein